MPYQRVKGLVTRVPVSGRAYPMSVEFVVESLPRAYFDMIELTA
jgi:hypothetical protein